MAVTSAFSRKKNLPLPIRKTPAPITRLDFRGIDLTSPYDVMKDNKSPYAKNFRMYSEEEDDRRVAISSRKGSGYYTNPVSEATTATNTSTTGASNAPVGVTTEWKAMKFTASSTGPLTKVELNLKNSAAASGPIVVGIYTDASGSPGSKIAESGILSSDVTGSYTYVPSRFVEAPTVTNGVSYWIVSNIQDDGSGTYYWSNNTASTLAKTSNTTGSSWSTTAYSLNFKVYISSTIGWKGMTRYAPTSGSNETLIALGTAMYHVNDVTHVQSTIATGLSSSASSYNFSFADDKAFWVNGFDDLKYWTGSVVETITHSQLPVCTLGVFHKNRFFGVSASDPNKLIYSEDPGNDDGAGNVWYRAYLSTSFIYIPSPKAADPITALVSFQDNLIIYTRTNKYILYGSDPGSFTVRQSTGNKGAVSQHAVFAEENFVYAVAPDGLYQFNGSSDKLISDPVQTEFSGIADLDKCAITKWKRIIRLYYPSSGSAHNNRCLLYHTVYEEWMLDTDTYVSQAVVWNDGSDDYNMIEASSVAPTIYYAEQDFHNVGKKIDFEYDCKNDSMGNPALRKRITRFFPLLKSELSTFNVQVAVVKNRLETATYVDLPLTVGGALIGHFFIGDGTLIGSASQFSPKKMKISGYAYYWQVRVKRNAINNPVKFIGYVLAMRVKKL